MKRADIDWRIEFMLKKWAESTHPEDIKAHAITLKRLISMESDEEKKARDAV